MNARTHTCTHPPTYVHMYTQTHKCQLYGHLSFSIGIKQIIDDTSVDKCPREPCVADQQLMVELL